jgi:hypothetical protein
MGGFVQGLGNFSAHEKKHLCIQVCVEWEVLVVARRAVTVDDSGEAERRQKGARAISYEP